MFSRIHIGLLTVAALVFSGTATPAAAQTYDASNDFSIASNPNGVWSYGFTETLHSSLILDTSSNSDPRGIDYWAGNRASDGNPGIYYNRTNTTITISTVTWLPKQIIQHPGPSGEYSTMRWTAPAAGTFTLDIGFRGQDTTTTDVHILKNGESLFSSTINGYGNARSYFDRVTIAASDVIDIKVGFGGNGFGNDSTGVRARITTVPAPGALLTALMGTLPGASLVIRRRRALKNPSG